MTVMAVANEPAEQGARPTPPKTWQGKSAMMEGGEMMMWMRPMMFKQLELSQEQQNQIAAVMGSVSNEMNTLRIQAQTLAKKQAELMGAEPIDEQAILQLADEIGGVRSAIAKAQIKQMLAARKILTAEQRLKMRELMKQYLENRDGKRPGKMGKGENKLGSTPKGESALGASVTPPVPSVPAAK